MVALVTSTISPTNAYSFYSATERLSQTITTVTKLAAAGFNDIYLFDNSLEEINFDPLIDACNNVKIFRSPQFTFNNKGLNEALLILNNIHHLPSDVPIFKISGRYYPSKTFSVDIFKGYETIDYVGKGYDFQKKIAGFSTKAYFVKNASVLTGTLVLVIEEMISYSKGIHGLKSFIKAVKQLTKPQIGTLFQLSMEQSFARVLKARYKYHLLDKMHIGGSEASATSDISFSE